MKIEVFERSKGGRKLITRGRMGRIRYEEMNCKCKKREQRKERTHHGVLLLPERHSVFATKTASATPATTTPPMIPPLTQ